MGKRLNIKNHVLKNGCEYETSPFGARKDPFSGKSSYHYGEDMISSKYGSDYIIAFQDGTVVSICNSVAGFSTTHSSGNYVYIAHAGSYQTRYLHLKKDSLTVKVGQIVRKGDIIAYMGTTGYSTGAHLHFEVRSGGKALDPIPYLNGEKNIPAQEKMTSSTETSDHDRRVGEIVNFLGGYHYANAQAIEPVGGKRSAGKAKITNIAIGKSHPYHLVGENGCNVYGWVDSITIDKEEGVAPSAPTAFKKGDIVQIRSGAKWYTGSNIPKWVMADKWIVYQDQVNDRVILHYNTSKKNAIMSPIHAKDLIKV